MIQDNYQNKIYVSLFQYKDLGPPNTYQLTKSRNFISVTKFSKTTTKNNHTKPNKYLFVN